MRTIADIAEWSSVMPSALLKPLAARKRAGSLARQMSVLEPAGSQRLCDNALRAPVL